jgi:hypothetical protein
MRFMRFTEFHILFLSQARARIGVQNRLYYATA